ncbi:MAG: hypothetical protein KGI71_04805 [Patescibacteria group bacterium]|nr:hypothetical protein [Patescibacteria group bacterium]
MLCCACGGPEFKAGALALQGDAEAPAEAAADVGGGAADSGAGDDGGGGEDAAPEAEAGQVCGPITSDASPIGCFGPLPRPSQFGLEGPDGGGCSGQATPAECQCAQTYNCACIAAHAIACAGSGAWVSCAMVDGVPVVRCSAL